MANDKELLIRVRADLKQALSGLDRLEREIGGVGKASARTEREVSRMGGSMRLLTRAAGAYLSLRLAKEIVMQADAYNVLQARIAAATRETGDYARVSGQLFRIAQANGAALADTVDVFQRLQLSAKALGATNQDILTVTDTVQKLGVIGGSSTAQMAAGLMQFSQALASGTVRAEEINSIIENLPMLANRLESALGLLPGQLRNAVNEGKVLSRDVFQALLQMAPEIAREFQDMPDSVGRASERLSNAFGKFLSDLDKATGFTRTIAELMDDIARSLTGAQRSIADIKADMDAAIKSSGSEKSGRNRGGAHKKRIEDLRDELNQALIAAKGPVGLRLAIDQIEAQLADFEAKLVDAEESRNIRAKEFIRRRIKELRAQRDQLFAALEETELGGDTRKSPPASQPDKAAEARQARIEKTIKALQIEAATYGMSAKEATLYRLAQEGASEAQLARARAALEFAESEAEFEAAVRASAEAVKAEGEAYDAWLQKLRDEGEQVYQQTRTAQERLNAELERYQVLLNQGVIDQDTYNRAVAQARKSFEEMEKSGDQAFQRLEAAVQVWGRAFTDTLADAVMEGKLNFRDLADSIIRDLIRIQIQRRITEPLLAAGTGWLGSIGFASGGPVVGPGSSTSDSIPARLSAGEYVVNAKAVSAYGVEFMEAINRIRLPRYTNFPRLNITRPGTHFASGGLVSPLSGTPVKVEIVNKGTPQRPTDAQATFDPDGLVVRIFTDDVARGGPIAGALESTYKLNRGR
ncbi:MAG TPA: hypothetical protein ENK05_11760 [Gammaproteobacteria bacterium]|nr:hypothetical protein [Gammaproteobacteria bacterium]